MSYDANGNMSSDGANTYTWNARNQLSGISGVTTASFVYDPFGRRLAKTIGSASTSFLYDGADSVQELSGSTITANLLTGGLDETFARADSSGTVCLLTDAQGSTSSAADASGSTVAQYTYDPFGNTVLAGASANPNQYAGRENDGTGLYYYRARYYDPVLARFVSQDPAGIAGGINPYVYADDSPITEVDPFGLSPAAGRGGCDPSCGPDGYRDATPAEEAKELRKAESYKGTPYKLGGKTPAGFDCSGFVCYAIQHSINPNLQYSPTSGMATNPGFRPLGPGESHNPGDVELFRSHTGFYDPSGASSGNSLLSAEGDTSRPTPGVAHGSPTWFPGPRRFLRPRVPCSH